MKRMEFTAEYYAIIGMIAPLIGTGAHSADKTV